MKALIFIIKKDNSYIIYRVEGCYEADSTNINFISYKDLQEHFVKWAYAIGNDNDLNYKYIHPSTIMTPFFKELDSRMEVGLLVYEKLMSEKHPIGHARKPIDVDYGCLYLASDESKLVTGTTLYIDGGYSAM